MTDPVDGPVGQEAILRTQFGTILVMIWALSL
jgi:hypothetical protein